MGKNIKRKTNVKSSVLVLLLIAILLIASTYAWFTANTTVTISTLDVHVEATNGLQISADAINWKAVLEKAEITPGETLNANYAANINKIATTLAPVSTIGTVTNDCMEMFLGTVKSNPTTGAFELSATQEPAPTTTTRGTNGNFIVFDVFLKIDADTQVRLTESSNVVFKSQAEGDTDRGLKNAARVGLVILGHADTSATTSQMQALTGGAGLDATYKKLYIWEPNYDAHTQAGANAATSIYGKSGVTAGTGNNALTYKGIKAAIPSGTPVALNETSGTYFGDVTPDIQTVAGTRAQKYDLMLLKAGVTKVRVYMWIEGQDVDCENTASGSDISFNLGFTIDE